MYLMELYIDVKNEFTRQIQNHPKLVKDQQDIFGAVMFGEWKHLYQTRKHSQQPYFIHCTKVALSVLNEPDVERDFVIAALLHDTLEDTDTSIEDITTRFGEKPGLIVKTLTKLPSSYKKEWGEERYYKEGFFGPIAELAKSIPFIWKINFADRLNNLETYWQFSTPEKIKEYVWETHQILSYSQGVDTPLKLKILENLQAHYT